MALVDFDAANYPGIRINEEGGASTFVLTVREALTKIVSQPVGQQMLKEICEHAPDFAGWNGKVKILRPAGRVVAIGRPGEEGGSRCAPISEANARNNVGSASAVYWNSNIWVVPARGQRPPFIGLAHELVHAWHCAHGTMKAGYDDEEMFTVGLGQYARADPTAITENRIRLEHGVAIRHQY